MAVIQQAVSQKDKTPQVPLSFEVNDLIAQLEKANLAHKIKVVENADGLFEVSGQLTSNEWSTWQRIAVWYDQVSGRRPPISSLNVGTQFQNPPAIAMLQISEPKQVILAGGATLKVGDTFSGDWKISGIDTDSIQVQRGNQTEYIYLASTDQ